MKAKIIKHTFREVFVLDYSCENRNRHTIKLVNPNIECNRVYLAEDNYCEITRTLSFLCPHCKDAHLIKLE